MRSATATTKRCSWVRVDDPLMLQYHDREWGVPVHDDRRHFEFLVLEGAQAGLSWTIVLKKREGYRRAFQGFDPEKVARFSADDWRCRSPDFIEPNLSRNLALRDALRPIAQRHRATVSAAAVAWVLAWPGVTGAIVGGRSPQQVDGWIGAASLQLTTADLQEISDAIVRTGAGEGPTLPQLERADASH